MKLNHPIPILEIAQQINAKLIGDPNIEVTHLVEIHKVCRGGLIFVDVEKYYNRAIYSSAIAIIINKEIECPEGKALLVVDDPFKAYNSLAEQYSPLLRLEKAHSETAQIGENTIIEPGVVLGNHVKIGDNCRIRANTVICDYTEIGNNVIIHPNTTIGSDAFYFHGNKDRSQERWHSIGRVVIHDDVEIGAGCTIDKGVSGDTIIGQGTKIDNQVHVGHGVEIGKHCILAAQVGIAGKTVVQDYVIMYGQVGVSKSLVIGEGATILAQAGVPKSIPGGKRYFGTPAADASTSFREYIALQGLPDMMKRFQKIEKALEERKIIPKNGKAPNTNGKGILYREGEDL